MCQIEPRLPSKPGHDCNSTLASALNSRCRRCRSRAAEAARSRAALPAAASGPAERLADQREEAADAVAEARRRRRDHALCAPARPDARRGTRRDRCRRHEWQVVLVAALIAAGGSGEQRRRPSSRRAAGLPGPPCRRGGEAAQGRIALAALPADIALNAIERRGWFADWSGQRSRSSAGSLKRSPRQQAAPGHRAGADRSQDGVGIAVELGVHVRRMRVAVGSRARRPSVRAEAVRLGSPSRSAVTAAPARPAGGRIDVALVGRRCGACTGSRRSRRSRESWNEKRL